MRAAGVSNIDPHDFRRNAAALTTAFMADLHVWIAPDPSHPFGVDDGQAAGLQLIHRTQQEFRPSACSGQRAIPSPGAIAQVAERDTDGLVADKAVVCEQILRDATRRRLVQQSLS
ncbi:MAG: hypothetical protein ACI9ZH_001706 [Paracoccaceae bacterium]|jgi:hypothetical protein